MGFRDDGRYAHLHHRELSWLREEHQRLAVEVRFSDEPNPPALWPLCRVERELNRRGEPFDAVSAEVLGGRYGGTLPADG